MYVEVQLARVADVSVTVVLPVAGEPGSVDVAARLTGGGSLVLACAPTGLDRLDQLMLALVEARARLLEAAAS